MSGVWRRSGSFRLGADRDHCSPVRKLRPGLYRPSPRGERALFSLPRLRCRRKRPRFASELAWTRRSRAPVFRELLDELVAHGARGRLLDVGCSFGLLLFMAKERGFEPCGVDLSLNAVRYARDRLGLSVHQGTLFDARFPDAAFDVVTMVG